MNIMAMAFIMTLIIPMIKNQTMVMIMYYMHNTLVFMEQINDMGLCPSIQFFFKNDE